MQLCFPWSLTLTEHHSYVTRSIWLFMKAGRADWLVKHSLKHYQVSGFWTVTFKTKWKQQLGPTKLLDVYLIHAEHVINMTVSMHVPSYYCCIKFSSVAEIFVWFYSVEIVFYYGAIQLGVWWFCHVVSLFWGIQFPFHFRSFKAAHRLKYIHIPMGIAGLVLPALPVTVISTAGVLDSSLQSVSLTFYSLLLPSNLLFAAGIPLLIIIIWIIHKVIEITTNTGN